VALRLRSLAAACALASAGATVAIAFVARLDWAHRAPSLHVALETSGAIAASAAAFLVLGRFRRTGFLDELLLSAGLLLLAVSNVMFAALPTAFGIHTTRGQLWALLLTGVVSALLICLAALLPRRRIRVGAGWPLAIYGSTLAVGLAGAVTVIAFPTLLPRPVTVSFPHHAARPDLATHPAVQSIQVCLAALYLLAAYGFARRHRITGDEFSGWLMVACIFSASARVNYFFHPSLLPHWVYTGDLFRLGFYIALLVGAAREIASYWRSEIEAASLEERRRVAYDVHDGFAQEIAFIGRNVQALRAAGADPELVDRVLEGVERAREESRRVMGALTAEPLSLDQALAEAAREAAGRHGTIIDMQLARGIEVSPRDQEAVVRLVSEAVTNAARHSGGDRLQVVLERTRTGLRVRVRDNGYGFDTENRGDRGFGLIGMRDRAEALGARLRIQSRRGRGTEVDFEL
jgi:signal transduction histidine kinase